jgi:hypothetical protein
VKRRLLAAAGRATLCAKREDLPYAYVALDGPVTFGDASDDVRRDIAVHYLGTELGQAYLDSNPAGDGALVSLTPERWHSVDYSKMDIPTA